MREESWVGRALDAKLLASQLIREADELRDRARVAVGELSDDLWEQSKAKFKQANKVMNEVI